MGDGQYVVPGDTFIGGVWSQSRATKRWEVVDPYTQAVIADVSDGDAHDVEAAVEYAQSAFHTWSQSHRSVRAGLLRSLAREIHARHEQFASLISQDVGTPIKIARRVQTGLPIAVLAHYADMLEEERPVERIGNSTILRQPVGVVAAITPWNFPLHQIICKLAPAVASGSTLVLKPSEVAPLSAYLLFECVEAAGFPPGVLNLVSGSGPTVGTALVLDPNVDHVSFTGSVSAGAAVASAAAQSIKRVTLELGGKSASIVLDDADLERAVVGSVNNAFLNSGQTCTAWTRLLVPKQLMGDAVKLAVARAEGMRLGDPASEATQLGPVASAMQRDRVLGHIERAGRESTLVTGGCAPPPEQPVGFFVSPTIFMDVDPDSSLAQEEVFGPVLAMIAYENDDDAVNIANNSRFGLHGAVWSSDSDRAHSVASRLRTGAVDINGGAYNHQAPFGGFKQSGYGRELGTYGLEEYTEIQAIQT